MKYSIPFYSLFVFLLFFQKAEAQNTSSTDGVSVYLFLAEECVVSQYFTQQLNQLYMEYANEKTNFLGLFPNPSSSQEKIDAFRQKYHLDFPLKLDVLQRNMDRFGVTITPEAVVFDHSLDKVIYQGRIDNTFFRVGKRRTVTTTSDLRDVLEKLKRGKEVDLVQTVPVGCIISPLSGEMKDMPMCVPEK